MNEVTKATCANCRFWSEENEDDWTASSAGFRVCKAVRERWTIQDEANAGRRWSDSDAERDAFEQRRVDALQKARAYVQDGSEYRADLVTGPDFFCALHQFSETP